MFGICSALALRRSLSMNPSVQPSNSDNYYNNYRSLHTYNFLSFVGKKVDILPPMFVIEEQRNKMNTNITLYSDNCWAVHIPDQHENWKVVR